MEAIPQPEPVYITGDMNVRFQAKYRHDGDVLGPFVYGKGAPYIDHTATSNRSLCIKMMQRNNMVEVASYKTPKMIQQITYKDKAAPPTDWSHFVMDPLVLQQFYGVVASKCSGQATQLAFRIRNLLDLPPLLHPPKIQPQVDPYRFQRLDHCFTRKQWLSSVHSCGSKLYTGFPSDHYLLVSDVQVKLASGPRTAQQSRPDFHNCTEASKEAFQKSVTAALLQQPATQHTDHTAPVHYYPDGSGTAGRCTMKTPAGWGFCYVLEWVWHDAYGPVPTDPTHPLFAGAHVGIEGNERADRLADQGKASAGRQGTTAPAQPRDHTALNFHGDIIMVLKEKAQEHFAPTGIARRKPWITETTLTLLAEARAATAQDAEDAKLKRNQAKTSAQKDKINWIHDQLTGDLAASSSTVWSTVRNQKKGFRARKTHLGREKPT